MPRELATCACGKVLVYPKTLAPALHSGCGITGTPHKYDDCPEKSIYIHEATRIIERMKKYEQEGTNE
jgi:hypothetical protein